MKGFSSPAEACHKFVSGQETMRICAQQSLVPTLEINTDNADWDCYADTNYEEIVLTIYD
ncbi:hypothetical protein GCM10023310_00100 [Paenibacillus vulneris]